LLVILFMAINVHFIGAYIFFFWLLVWWLLVVVLL
jgi:hypothetical protein